MARSMAAARASARRRGPGVRWQCWVEADAVGAEYVALVRGLEGAEATEEPRGVGELANPREIDQSSGK